MQRASAWCVAAAGLALLVLIVVACGSQEPRSVEERALSIDKSLMCPICAGQTIDQSAATLSAQMRAIVRQKLAEGWTRDQILQFFVDRYDESVLAAPPKEGFNLIVWVVPFAAVLGAGSLLFFVLKSVTRDAKTRRPEEATPRSDLEPYLSLVDRELGLSEGSGESEKQG